MMNDVVKVAGHPGLVRDKSGAIINVDTESYQAYIESRRRATSTEERVTELERKLDTIIDLLRQKQ